MKALYDILEEWADKVKPKWHPKEGLFTGDNPQEIADYLLKHSEDREQAMQRLVFYMNRAGDDCPNKIVLNKVKKLLSESIPAGCIAESILDTDFDVDDISVALALAPVYDMHWWDWGKSKGTHVADAVQILADTLETIAKMYKKSKLPMCDVIYNIREGVLYMLAENKKYIRCSRCYGTTSAIRLESDGEHVRIIRRFMKDLRIGKTVEIKVPLAAFENICDKLELE